MPQKSDDTVHILEGQATLFKRPMSPIWHVRFKVHGKWERQTSTCHHCQHCQRSISKQRDFKMLNFNLRTLLTLSITLISLNIYSQDLGKPFRDLIDGGQSNSSNEFAVLLSQNRTGDNSIQNCQYRTERGFTFTVSIRANPCPRTVSVNVQTMQVQVPNF